MQSVRATLGAVIQKKIVAKRRFSYILGGFPSGQRGQTVNLLAMLSKVRILLRPFFSFYKGNYAYLHSATQNGAVSNASLKHLTIIAG